MAAHSSALTTRRERSGSGLAACSPRSRFAHLAERRHEGCMKFFAGRIFHAVYEA